MPRTTRETVKQDLDRAIGNIDNAKDKLGRWIELYSKNHPQVAASFHLSVELLTQVQELIKKTEEYI